MTNSIDLYRANSIRVLAKILDHSMLGQVERYMSQAIVDKNELVSSSALLAGLQFIRHAGNIDIIRRWVSEIQTALSTKSDAVQFHALALLRTVKQGDRLAMSKLVVQMMKGQVRSPLAVCLLIRYTSAMLVDDTAGADARVCYEFLEVRTCVLYAPAALSFCPASQ